MADYSSMMETSLYDQADVAHYPVDAASSLYLGMEDLSVESHIGGFDSLMSLAQPAPESNGKASAEPATATQNHLLRKESSDTARASGALDSKAALHAWLQDNGISVNLPLESGKGRTDVISSSHSAPPGPSPWSIADRHTTMSPNKALPSFQGTETRTGTISTQLSRDGPVESQKEDLGDLKDALRRLPLRDTPKKNAEALGKKVNELINDASGEPKLFKFGREHLTTSQELTDILKELRNANRIPVPPSPKLRTTERGLGALQSSATLAGQMTGSKAVLSAINALQDKIRRLERERDELLSKCSDLKTKLREQEASAVASEKKLLYEFSLKEQQYQHNWEQAQQEREDMKIEITKLDEQKKALLREIQHAKERCQESESDRRTALAKVTLLERKLQQTSVADRQRVTSATRPEVEESDDDSYISDAEVRMELKKMRERTERLEKLLTSSGRRAGSRHDSQRDREKAKAKQPKEPRRPLSVPSSKVTKPKKEQSTSAAASVGRPINRKKPAASRKQEVPPNRASPRKPAPKEAAMKKNSNLTSNTPMQEQCPQISGKAKRPSTTKKSTLMKESARSRSTVTPVPGGTISRAPRW